MPRKAKKSKLNNKLPKVLSDEEDGPDVLAEDEVPEQIYKSPIRTKKPYPRGIQLNKHNKGKDYPHSIKDSGYIKMPPEYNSGDEEECLKDNYRGEMLNVKNKKEYLKELSRLHKNTTEGICLASSKALAHRLKTSPAKIIRRQLADKNPYMGLSDFTPVKLNPKNERDPYTFDPKETPNKEERLNKHIGPKDAILALTLPGKVGHAVHYDARNSDVSDVNYPESSTVSDLLKNYKGLKSIKAYKLKPEFELSDTDSLYSDHSDTGYGMKRGLHWKHFIPRRC